MAILLVVPMAQAAEIGADGMYYDVAQNYTCISNNLNIYANVTVCTGGHCNATTFNQTVDCEYGCAVGFDGMAQCNPHQFTNYGLILGFIVLVFVVLVFVGSKRR